MTNFPWSTKKKETKPRRRKSSTPLTLEDAQRRILIRKAMKNPEWAEEMWKKEKGIIDTDPIEIAKQRILAKTLEEDPEFIQLTKQEYLKGLREKAGGDGLETLDDKVTEAAMEKLENDPKRLAQLVDAKLDELMSSRNRSPLEEFMDEMDKYEEARERFGMGSGGSKGALGGLIDGEVIGKIVDVVGNLITGGKQVQTLRTRYYVVETTEGLKELNEEEYHRWRMALPPGKATTTETHATGDDETSLDKETVPPVSTKPSLNLGLWLPYLEAEPSSFIDYLIELANGGDDTAQYALGFILKCTSAESLITVIEAVKPKVEQSTKDAIDKISAKPEWVQGCIDYAKSLLEEEQNKEGGDSNGNNKPATKPSSETEDE